MEELLANFLYEQRVARMWRKVIGKANAYDYTPHLPNDVIEEILARLPAVCLYRLRIVSRAWAELFASDAFIEFHLQRANDGRPKVFRPPLVWPNSQVPIYSWEPAGLVMQLVHTAAGSDQSRLAATTPCRGLYLFRGLDKKIYRNNAFRHYYVFNPSIRDVFSLPDLRRPADAYEGDGWVDRLHGLGYDSSTKEYKVARIYYYDNFVSNTTVTRCEILTLGASMRWRLAAEQPPSKIIQIFISELPACQEDGVFSDGCLHWKLTNSTTDSGYILRFDIHDQTFCTVEFPPGIQASQMGALTRLDGRLCFQYSLGKFGEEFIWMLQDSKDGRWEKHRAFDRRAWPPAVRKLLASYSVRPLAMYYVSGHKRKIMFESKSDVVFEIDPDNGALEILIVPEQMVVGWQYGGLCLFPPLQLFEESLVFVANRTIAPLPPETKIPIRITAPPNYNV